VIGFDHRPFADRDEMDHVLIELWNGYHRGAWHIYGHIHNRRDEAFEFMKTKDHALNAGCMINNYTPASFNELVRNNEAFKNNERRWL
jgi:calcineurin-like phosphoesterase family protein